MLKNKRPICSFSFDDMGFPAVVPSFIASATATASSLAAFLVSVTASASVARGPFGLGRAQGTARASVAFLSLRAARISCVASSFLLTSFSIKARLFTESRVWGCFAPSAASLGLLLAMV